MKSSEFIESIESIDENICIICHDPFENTNLYNTPCNHTMHYECFKKWFCTNKEKNIRPTCPICRNIINNINEGSVSRLINVTDINCDSETERSLLINPTYEQITGVNENWSIILMCGSIITSALIVVFFIVYIICIV